MRKKSHIKLASVIFNTLEDKAVNEHKFCFMVGAILPDIVPTFLWKKHRIDTTRQEFERTVRKFIYEGQHGMLHSIRAGVITHYLSDYFTFPHNKECTWGLWKHNMYEGNQLKKIKFLGMEDIKNLHPLIQNINSLEDLFEAIKELHKEYLKRVQDVVDGWLEVDLEYIEYVSVFVMEVLLWERPKLLGISLDHREVLV